MESAIKLKFMKASISLGSEIDIVLSSKEASGLEKQALSCLAKVRELPSELGPERIVELSIGQMKSNLFVELESLPKNACFEEIAMYKVTVSAEGYGLLIKNRYVCDRTGAI
ncbi:MAG: hypothetical protein QXM31_04190, partial [Candidatus Woesearchaeota archaeon]